MFKTKWTKMEVEKPPVFQDMFLRTQDNEILFGYLSVNPSVFKVKVTGANSKYKIVRLVDIKDWTAKLGVTIPSAVDSYWMPINPNDTMCTKPPCFDEIFLLGPDGNVSVCYLVDASKSTMLPTGERSLESSNIMDVPVASFTHWCSCLTYPRTKRKAVKKDATAV